MGRGVLAAAGGSGGNPFWIQKPFKIYQQKLRKHFLTTFPIPPENNQKTLRRLRKSWKNTWGVFFECFWSVLGSKMDSRPNRPQPLEPPAQFLITKTLQKHSKNTLGNVFWMFFDIFRRRRNVFWVFSGVFWVYWKSCQKNVFWTFWAKSWDPRI